MSSCYNLQFICIQSKTCIGLLKNHVALRNILHCCSIQSSAYERARYSAIQRRKQVKPLVKNQKTVFEENQEKTFLRQLLKNETKDFEDEQIVEMSFGEIRFDVQNKPSYSPPSKSRLKEARQHIEASDYDKQFPWSNVKSDGITPSNILKTQIEEPGGSAEILSTLRVDKDKDLNSEAAHKHNKKGPFISNIEKKKRSEKSPIVSSVHALKDVLPEFNLDNSSNSGTNYFDEQYFDQQVLSTVKIDKHKLTQNNITLDEFAPKCISPEENAIKTKAPDAANYFDEQYFGQPSCSEVEKESDLSASHMHVSDRTSCKSQVSGKTTKDHCVDANEKENFFDEQYFSVEGYHDASPGCEGRPFKDPVSRKDASLSHVNHLTSEKQVNCEKDRVESGHQYKSRQNRFGKISNTDTSSPPTLSETKQDGHEANQENVSALDVVQEIRRQQHKAEEITKASTKMTDKQLDANPWAKTWDGKVDSRGFRVLSSQVPDLKHYLEEDIVYLLKKRIIYEDDELLAIDKPYGLASHGGPGVHHSVGRFLKPLSQKISKSLDTLYLVHRLDKETTGVMLLAKNNIIARRLVELFKKRQVIKKYWVLTKGVPVPEEGVIDIPMAEGTVEGKHRDIENNYPDIERCISVYFTCSLNGWRYKMALRPRYPTEMKPMHKGSPRKSKGQDAVTNFRVLSKFMSSALVECQPESGIKHQIRCHLAFGLNTPILGDHKYSHLSKIAPQKLHPDILQRLGIRQSKVRTLPMHLHAKTVILPEFRDGKNIFIQADVPKYFKQNMKWLKIKRPIEK